METNNNQKGIGIFDFTKTSSLGDILIFIENLKIYQERFNVKKIDIKIIIGEDNTTVFNLFLPLIYQYLEIDECQLISSLDIEVIYNVTGYYQFVFPSKEEFLSEEFTLDSTKIVQEFFKEKKPVPKLISKRKETNYKINQFLKEKSVGNVLIAVHLKYNSATPCESNANIDEWYKFFEYCGKNKFPIQFFLIGDNQIKIPSLSLQNVIKTIELGLNIIDDLALIEEADLFMGICSGPFRIALFNDKPYIVFKNPNHHKEEMIKEIGKENKYPFAAEKQKIFRELETSEKMIEELLKVFPLFKYNIKREENYEI